MRKKCLPILGICTALLCTSIAAARPQTDTSLLQKLQDPDPLTRESAALALGVAGQRAAVPMLIKLLASDENRWVRARAAEALGYLGDPAAIRPLRSALHEEKHPRVRRALGEALLRLGQRTGLQELLWQLESGNHYEKAEVMKALIRLTAAPLGQDPKAWWAHFSAQGYRALTSRPGGSPSLLELRGLRTAPEDPPRGPWLSAARPPSWQVMCASVIQLKPRWEAVDAAALKAHQRRHGPPPDGCLLLVHVPWKPAPPTRANVGSTPAPPQPPKTKTLPAGPGLTADAAEYLLAQAPKLMGLGINAPRLDAPLTSGAKAALLAKHRIVLESVGDLDRLPALNFRLLMVPQDRVADGRRRPLLLALFQ